MWQARSSNVRPTAGSLQPLVRVRRERSGKIGPGGRTHPSASDTGALRDTRNEWSIVQQAIAGNTAAQEHLFAHHNDRLYRTAFSILRNKEDAEDALQDALCRAYASLASFRGQSSFSTWLTRVVINSALMTRRKRSAHPEASLDEILESKPQKLPGAVDARPNPEKICATIELYELVEGQVHQLPPLLQTAFRLRVTDSLSTAEFSQALGIPTGTFKTRIARARRKVADGLQRVLQAK
jgi:RNA polymerase sigma factor (sigma-70 family)